MKKLYLLFPVILLSSCASNANPIKEEFIYLYSETSRLYSETLKEEDSPLLKTYRHKKFGDVPFISLEEFCEIIDKTEIDEKKQYTIKNNKFIIYDQDQEAFVFDAKKDTITTSANVNEFFRKARRTNNGIPFDMYRKKGFDKFTKESTKTKYLVPGQSRVYDCKKYNFDIVYEDGKYYAPFTLLSYLFYGYINTTFMYNGKNFFDCDPITETYPTVAYCYSSKGDFLLDRTGNLGAVLYKNVTPKLENEVYRFENIIESSGQLTVFSLLNNGTGTLKSYDSEGQEIDDGVYVKAEYTLNECKTEMDLRYYSVFQPEDTEPISEISTLRINLDETNFRKKVRSQEVADFTYQELRFAFYELYGNTKNNEIKDFDSFIEKQDYKDDLLSTDILKYDDAMAKLLLIGVDDAHTTIHYPSIYNEPTFANANYYSLRHEGQRRKYITSTLIANENERRKAGFSQGLDIHNETAFITFDKFVFSEKIKGYNEYKNTDPSEYASEPMELFASSFNKIKENNNIKNIVIDLTCNGGGLIGCLSYLLAYFTKDPTIVTNIKMNNATMEYHYEVDLDQDGVYASDSDTFAGEYNYYIMTSSASFSCANHFATLCRNLGFGKVIGERNGGGSCVISFLANSSGYLYHSSSEWTSLLYENNEWVTNDNGVLPDIEIDAEHFYQRDYIDNLLSTSR